MTKPGALNDKLAKWAFLLFPYDIHFVPQKSTRGETIANFLAEYPIPKNSKFHEDIPDNVAEIKAISKEQAWQLFFDSTTRKTTAGVGVVLIFPHKHVIPKGYLIEI